MPNKIFKNYCNKFKHKANYEYGWMSKIYNVHLELAEKDYRIVGEGACQRCGSLTFLKMKYDWPPKRMELEFMQPEPDNFMDRYNFGLRIERPSHGMLLSV